MSKNIDELASQAGQMLAELGYMPGTIQHYKSSWNKARRWCSERDIKCFDREQEEQFIVDMGLNGNVLSRVNRKMLRQVRTLLSLDNDGCLPPYSRALSEDVPDRFRHVFDAYVSVLEQRSLARSSIRGQSCLIRKFMVGLRINDFTDLSMEDVTAHLEACSWMTAQSRAGILYAIRAFTAWAAGEELCSPAVAAAMPVIPGHKHAALPSAYAVTEVAAMVAATGAGCPRRDRAMLLLASVLGMRAGDIRALRLGSLDWRAREVRFTQAKTGNPVRLPLPEEVMLALADYLRNERPKNPNEHVFLHHRAPHDSFEDAVNAFHYVATGAYVRASVNTMGKHHGMHSLRHSAATNMLSGHTGYPVISGILGHSNANTTRKYMAIDVERLRVLSLEVPRG
ncbi:tyrosine-type recombinase/integrase [Arthrobacter sp. SDTb3-6]|uniref:tyrosine-type recombinase/integrase n=1 Tax=Arthrobacter sp. SDTb3-6 TaxID=2713571 RepID=UPI00159DDF6A|nr:tyrosine-type recombinase/integrase [Arthrobacter sp. SDTb3-6]NVM98495.1 tyrosine-type recombinase/integrase [Arthrobacter sp. SDTb3-6]